jgi:predicted GNAT family acetyltransferase
MDEGQQDGLDEVVVVDVPARERYEILVGGELAGFIAYRLAPGRIVFVHSEIDGAFEGQGLAGRLARHALDDARARGLTVVAECPYIATWIERHPDYGDLLAS